MPCCNTDAFTHVFNTYYNTDALPTTTPSLTLPPPPAGCYDQVPSCMI